jgi:hypothetical protein
LAILSPRSRSMPWYFPLLQRPSFGISRKVWEQVEQQPVGGIQLDAKIVNPPYLHHSTPFISFSRSGTDFQPRHFALIFRESPVDNYVSNSQVGYNIGMFVQPCVGVAMLEYLILWFLLRVTLCRVRPVCGLHPGMIVTYGIMDKNL